MTQNTLSSQPQSQSTQSQISDAKNAAHGIENLLGFLSLAAISVVSVFLLAHAGQTLMDQFIRFNSFDLLRAFGGVA